VNSLRPAYVNLSISKPSISNKSSFISKDSRVQGVKGND
jgi:hypothetical protein